MSQENTSSIPLQDLKLTFAPKGSEMQRVNTENGDNIKEIAASLDAFPYIGFEGDQRDPYVVLKLMKPYGHKEKPTSLAPQVLVYPGENRVSFDRVSRDGGSKVRKGSRNGIFEVCEVSAIEVFPNGIRVTGELGTQPVRAELVSEGYFSVTHLHPRRSAA